MFTNVKSIIGVCLTVAGFFDAWKYVWQSTAIKRVGTSKGHSRKFANAAIGQDLIKLIYGIAIRDIFIICTSFMALVTMLYYFITIYLYYPYRMRGCYNFKRPNIWEYFINSLLPNRIRKRL